MSGLSLSPRAHPEGWRAAAIALVMAVLLCATQNAQAQDAPKILRSMTDYVAGQKNISLTFDTDIEVITSDLQKIQFANSGQMLLSRPNKIRASRVGGYADVELVFDGKLLTVMGRHLNAFAQAEAPGSIDDLVGMLRDKFGVSMPGADLLLTSAFEDLMTDVRESKHIGRGVIDGIECDHLAFRSADVDWQIWVQVGDRPIPRKYVITNKAVTGAPQYTLRVKDWKTDMQVAADAFAFMPPADAKNVDFSGLTDIDEVPNSATPGETK